MTTAADIERWLQLGLGRAFLALREDPSLAPPELILEACLHNQALDRQLEGSRAEYMYAILELYKNDEARWKFFRNALVQALESFDETSTDYDVQQVYWLVNRYADDGDYAAKAAIYRHFDQFPTLAWWVGAEVLTALDGLVGFIHAIERLDDTADIEDFDRQYIGGMLIDTLEERLGSKIVQAEFDVLRVTNTKVKHFFRPNPKSRTHREARKDVPYSEIQTELRSGNRQSIAPFEWVKTATPADLEAVADDLINRTTPPLFLLRVFRFVEFPRDPALLMPFAHDADKFIQAAAFGALERLTHPSIRTFALECIAADHQIGRSAGLLEKHLEPDDWWLFERLSRRELDADSYHSLGFSILQLFDAHPSPDAVAAFLNLYERIRCAHCRERIIEALHKFGALPSWMKEECRHDSSRYVREWVEEIGD